MAATNLTTKENAPATRVARISELMAERRLTEPQHVRTCPMTL